MASDGMVWPSGPKVLAPNALTKALAHLGNFQWVLKERVLIPIVRAPALQSNPNYLPKAPFPNTLWWGVHICICGNANIPSITHPTTTKLKTWNISSTPKSSNVPPPSQHPHP